MAGEGVFPKSNGDIAYASDFNRIDIKMATANWATIFTTSSTSYVDITSATVTVSGLVAGTVYNLFAMSTGTCSSSASGTITDIKMVIDGTNTGISSNQFTGYNPYGVSGFKSSVTGATSYTAKLQMKSDGTGTATNNNASLRQDIILIAFPQ